jgi:hypothetical protein
MTFDAFGQKQSLKEQLVGTWTLLSWEQRKGDGTKVERYGTSPKGIPEVGLRAMVRSVVYHCQTPDVHSADRDASRITTSVRGDVVDFAARNTDIH